jgi:hypothetical protein
MQTIKLTIKKVKKQSKRTRIRNITQYKAYNTSDIVLKEHNNILKNSHSYLNTEKIVEQGNHIVKMQEKAATRMSAHKKL